MSRTFIALLVVILQQQPSRGSGSNARHLCEIQNDYLSNYVVPYYERFDVGAGCVSTNVTDDGMEVHVINMIGGSSADPTAEVILHLQPRTHGLHRTPLVFVLNSRHPVFWRVQSENITNTTRNNFLISNNSRLFKDDNMRIKIRKYGTMPTEQAALMEWTRSQYGAITSYTEFNKANTFFKKVGINDSEPSSCVITPNALFQSSIPAYLVRQKSSGCTAPWNAGRNSRDIHILELHSGTESVNDLTKADVAIDIHTKGRSVQKKLTLIIKSHRPVRLGIRTKNVRGDLNIFTEQEVDSKGVGNGMQRVAVAVEPAVSERGRRELMEWVAEKYGPALTYTEAELANKFDLIVDGGDDMPTRHMDYLPQNDLINPFDHKLAVWQVVNQHMEVTCESRGMRVTLNRAALMKLGITSSHLSLVSQAENCWARANSTHYILYTPLKECGTKMTSNDDGRTSFLNGILLHDLQGRNGINLDEEGSAADPGDADDTHVDDEDYRTAQPFKWGFQCDYDTGIMKVPDQSPRHHPDKPIRNMPTADARQYELNLYEDASFRPSSKVSTYPMRAQAGQTIYVEVKLNSDIPGREAVIDSCWLTSIEEELANKPVHHLIINRCVRDNELTFINESDTRPTKHKYFHFKFIKYRANKHITFLQCDLTQCNRNGTHLAVQTCVDPSRYCVNNWPQENGLNRHRTGVATTVGPITDLFTVTVSSGGKDGCGKQVHVPVQGLDSGMVVAVAFSAFCIGILLTAVLWFIHVHTTGPIRKSNRQRSTETSGESTPSSTAPITVHQIHA